MPSLSVPDVQHPLPTPESLAGYEAARLFVDRAAAALPSFIVTNENAPAVAQVCQRLDGIPLALELAAARVKELPVEKIAERLDDRFRLLTGGSRTALPRQQTLRALIDWSYDLLAGQEQELLRQLSVFAGGWTLEAAEVVCAGDGIEEWAVLSLLTQLVDKSLVSYEEQGAETRYRLLETVRQYAQDRLLEAGGAEAVRSRHQRWFLALAEQAEPELMMGGNQENWFGRLDAEHDNIRAALAWALEVDPASALRLAGALWRFWEVRGYCGEGRAALERGLERLGDTPAEVRARGWSGPEK